MKSHLQSLRPVGNPILFHSAPLESALFGNLEVKFYQSGTAALAAALLAVKSRLAKNISTPEVLLPAYACPDLISACLYARVTPILIDLEPNSCWMQLKQIESAITKNTIGIIAVRFLGIAERMYQLRNICDHYNLCLIEDSAQGFPTHLPDAYWQGDLNILSFGRGKPVNLLGGGAVVIRNMDLNRYLPAPEPDSGKRQQWGALKYHAKVRLYNLLIKPLAYGMATKLPGLNIGETIYKPLHGITTMPAAIYEQINSNINYYINLPNVSEQIHERLMPLVSNRLIDLPHATQHDFANPLLRYPLLITEKKNRDQLYHNLQPFGASLMYREPLYDIEGIPSKTRESWSKMTNAEEFAKQMITLPTHTDVSTNILEKINVIIQDILD